MATKVVRDDDGNITINGLPCDDPVEGAVLIVQFLDEFRRTVEERDKKD